MLSDDGRDAKSIGCFAENRGELGFRHRRVSCVVERGYGSPVVRVAHCAGEERDRAELT